MLPRQKKHININPCQLAASTKMTGLFKQIQRKMVPKLRINRLVRKNKMMIYMYSSSILLTTGFCVSSMALNNNNNNKIIADYTHDNIEDHFHLLEALRELVPQIDAKRMLKRFLKELKDSQQSDGTFSSEFVRQLFIDSGIVDQELISRLIEILDWNHNEKLTKYDIAAICTLFNVGPDIERYRFLFRCLDLEQSGTVNKEEFRQIMRSLLTAKYHMNGLYNPRDPDEIYIDIGINEYHTMAKFAANQLVRKIFIFEDQKRTGKLNWTEFLHWCKRGGQEVKVLKELLYQTHDESFSSEQIHQYRVGHIPDK